MWMILLKANMALNVLFWHSLGDHDLLCGVILHQLQECAKLQYGSHIMCLYRKFLKREPHSPILGIVIDRMQPHGIVGVEPMTSWSYWATLPVELHPSMHYCIV